MTDNITGRFSNRKAVDDNIFQSDLFDPTLRVKSNGGEIKGRSLSLENMCIKSTNTYDELKGSIHSFYNAINGMGIQNYNDFSLSSTNEAISELEERIKIHASQIILTNFEEGLNIDPVFATSGLVTDSFLMFKFLPPCENYNDRKKVYKKFMHEQFGLKVYDKALEYKLIENMLRIEIVYRTKKLFNQFGVYSLDDLRKKDCHVKMFDDFMERYDNDLLFIDSYKGTDEMGGIKNVTMAALTNPSLWADFKKNSKANEFNIYKKQLNEWIEEYGLDSRKKYIKNLMIDKFYTLLES